jgi:hypothetical protein
MGTGRALDGEASVGPLSPKVYSQLEVTIINSYKKPTLTVVTTRHASSAAAAAWDAPTSLRTRMAVSLQ